MKQTQHKYIIWQKLMMKRQAQVPGLCGFEELQEAFIILGLVMTPIMLKLQTKVNF